MTHALFLGQTIFTGVDTSEEGKPSRRIWIPKNDSTIQIPCAVSNPKIRVTLEKSAGVSYFAIGKKMDAHQFCAKNISLTFSQMF